VGKNVGDAHHGRIDLDASSSTIPKTLQLSNKKTKKQKNKKTKKKKKKKKKALLDLPRCGLHSPLPQLFSPATILSRQFSSTITQAQTKNEIM
jgi:hypothetical protein